MSKMMILGVKGEAGLWLVDFDAGTVTATDGKREDYISYADGVRAADDEFQSADVAVAFETKETAFSGHFFAASTAADVRVVFETKEAAFAGHFFRTPVVPGRARSA